MDENQNNRDNPYLSPGQDRPEEAAPAPLADTSDAFTTKLGDTRHWWEKLRKKDWIAIGVVSGVLVLGIVTFVVLNRKEPVKLPPTATKTKEGKPIVSALTGLPVTEADRQRPVTAVMIENSLAARPQSGLRDAGVVYEAIAEYGITRFMALYQEAKPANIGPVRSARLYYAQWAQGYDAAYAHVGGSPEALRYIRAQRMKDMDQSFNASSFRRINTREAPHNVYTTMTELNDLEKAKGWFTEPDFTGFSRKKEAPSKTPGAKAIDINISTSAYQVHYDYDPPSNSYKRSQAGAPHLDAESKQQLTSKNVVALVVPYKLQADGYHSEYALLGRGQAFIFQDGNVIKATWTKGSPTERLGLQDATGKEFALNPGQTWVSVVGTANAVISRP